ncbi:ABC transporter ATP-binding protein [Terrihalobacillus insolitus]|uniref:ABC transporter ATP-binding protein n=1 Tax=Terrihalobacillus insolitus TaxID=2950438 RepID=UPI002340E3D6|nr:ABC transporter ATP-binding protein [Terrihalobacillus insolitus]MDC3413494.1 ATP-binding cassette domain-containing protein [Terrihalobacillus insolitus]
METIASVQNVRLKFPGADSLLFRDFSLSFQKGEKVLIVGPSGSGKSTLLQVLTGLIPSSVEIPIKADDIKIPSSWGFLFQDPDTQFCMPYVDEEIAFVLENLQIPREEMQKYIRYYLEQVGLEFDDIHTKIQTLSGGMKQRLAIASVLALESDTLFLDEPTAMLDPEGTEEVWQTLKKVGKEKTLVIVEHKLDHVIDFVDRFILLGKNGEIIADGRTQEIFHLYKDVLREEGIWYPGVWQDYTEQHRRQTPKSDVGGKNPVLSLNHFSGYRGKNKRIEVENLDVFPGEWITVLGHNGAGKSTLLHALMDLIKSKGSYQILGKDANKIKKLSDYVAFVFQNPEFQFVTNAVYDEIAYTLQLENENPDKVSERVDGLLRSFHLAKQKQNHPYQLSMGQKRRLSVAAAIVKEQPILLLDEPTFGQDAKNTFAILELLDDLRAQGIAIIMVTHDINIVEHFATRVWYIDKGILVHDCAATPYVEAMNDCRLGGQPDANGLFLSRNMAPQN